MGMRRMVVAVVEVSRVNLGGSRDGLRFYHRDWTAAIHGLLKSPE